MILATRDIVDGRALFKGYGNPRNGQQEGTEEIGFTRALLV